MDTLPIRVTMFAMFIIVILIATFVLRRPINGGNHDKADTTKTVPTQLAKFDKTTDDFHGTVYTTETVPAPLAKFDKITNGLYLGPHNVTADQLRDVGVTHVIRLLPRDFQGGDTFGYDVFDWPKQNELVTYINDTPLEKIMPSVKLYVKSIINIIKEGGVVYVHCMAGISRSGSVVIGYIMNKYHMKAEDALAFVRERRPCVNPNRGFTDELKGGGPQIWLIK